MNKGSQTVVLGAMTVTVLNASVASLSKSTVKYPALRILFGGFIVTVTLLVVSDYNAQLAEAFAILIMLGTVIGSNGEGLIALAGKLTGTNTTITPVRGTILNPSDGQPK